MSEDILVIINYPLMEQVRKGNIDLLETLFDTLAEEFDAVHVMSLKDVNSPDVYHFNSKVKVYPVPPVVGKPWLLKYLLSLPREIGVARKIVKNNPVRVVRALALLPSGYIAAKVAREAGIPVIVSMHENRKFNEKEEGRRGLPFIEFAERKVAGNVSLMPVINNYIRQRALELGVPDEKIVLHWNFASDKFSPGKLAKNRFLFVGRLEPVKRVDVLLEAFSIVKKSVPDAKFVIAGDGSMRSAWEALAEKLGITESVEFVGAVAHDELPGVMRSCSALVVVTGGFTVIESFACGLPVIAVRDEWLGEIVEDNKTGFLVTTRKAGDFAKAMLKLLKCDLQKMSVQCRKTAEERFSVKSYRERERSFYKKLGIN